MNNLSNDFSYMWKLVAGVFTPLQRDSRIRLYREEQGCLSGPPIDMDLGRVPDDEFEEIRALISSLRRYEWSLGGEYLPQPKNHVYRIEIGDKGSRAESLALIFNGTVMLKTPEAVTRLETILKNHAGPWDMTLKP